MSVPPLPLTELFASHDWLTLLDVSLTGIHLVRPVYEPDGSTIVDFAIEYLNPAAQRMTGLGEQPGGTLLGRFPHALAEGIFQYYQRVFETGEQLTYETNYQADGLDNLFRFSARRSGAHLLVSFTDTSEQNRSAVEEALRESQAAERAARAEAEAQRQRFYEVLLALPAQVATYHGPDHVYHFVNARYQQCFAPQAVLLGRSVRDTNPEVGEQGIFALMDRVYQTGEPFQGRELEVWVDFTGTGQREQVFLNICLYPLRDAQGRIDGLLDFSYDVTEPVRARRQVEHLNQELEARVRARTQEVEAARAEAERQHRQWYDLFMRAPASISIFGGPQWVYEFVNPGYQAMFPDRELLGKRLVDALPEVADQPLMAILHRVYDTGEPFQEREVMVPLARTAGGPIEIFTSTSATSLATTRPGRLMAS